MRVGCKLGMRKAAVLKELGRGCGLDKWFTLGAIHVVYAQRGRLRTLVRKRGGGNLAVLKEVSRGYTCNTHWMRGMPDGGLR